MIIKKYFNKQLKLKNIVETFREIATAAGSAGSPAGGEGYPAGGAGSPGGSVTDCNMEKVNDLKIDPKLQRELQALAGLATRKGNDIPLEKFFKYNHGLDNPMTISELK